MREPELALVWLELSCTLVLRRLVRNRVLGRVSRVPVPPSVLSTVFRGLEFTLASMGLFHVIPELLRIIQGPHGRFSRPLARDVARVFSFQVWPCVWASLPSRRPMVILC